MTTTLKQFGLLCLLLPVVGVLAILSVWLNARIAEYMFWTWEDDRKARERLEMLIGIIFYASIVFVVVISFKLLGLDR